MNRRTKRLLTLGLVAVAVVGLAFLRGYLQELDDQAEAKSSRQYAPVAAEDHPALVWYREREPDKEILLACADDITADGLEDMVLVYRIERGAAEAVALVAQEDNSYYVSPPIAAPQQNQKMRFFNMDRDPQLEFLLTGDKNGQVGYAVFRIIDGQITNLFGEGMEDCC